MCYVADGSGKPSTTRIQGVGEKTATKACDTGNLAPNSFALPVGRGRIAELKHLSVCFVCWISLSGTDHCPWRGAVPMRLQACVFQDDWRLHQGRSVAEHHIQMSLRRAGWKAENAERQPSDDRYFTPEKNILKLG